MREFLSHGPWGVDYPEDYECLTYQPSEVTGLCRLCSDGALEHNVAQLLAEVLKLQERVTLAEKWIGPNTYTTYLGGVKRRVLSDGSDIYELLAILRGGRYE